MYRKAHPLFILCDTPTHVGSGSDLGIIDLPIQRERHTSFPKIEGSSMKGAIREAVERKVNLQTFAKWDADDVKIHRVFGYDDGSLTDSKKSYLKERFTIRKGDNKEETISEFSGCVGFSDARLLLFPMKSMRGVFAWITCYQVLKQFEDDMKLAEIKGYPTFESKDLDTKMGEGLVAKGSKLLIPNTLTPNVPNVVLEEYAFKVREDGQVNQLGEWLANTLFADADNYWKSKIKTNIIILSDDDFKDFVNLSTEVITRTKIDNEKGTVAKGALFTEEYLPAESILYALTLVSKEFFKDNDTNSDGREGMTEVEVHEFLQKNLPSVLQIGGNATIGKGIVRTKLIKGGE